MGVGTTLIDPRVALPTPPTLSKQSPPVDHEKHVKDIMFTGNSSFNYTGFLGDWPDRDIAPNFIPPYWQFIHPYVATSLLVFTSVIGVVCNLFLCCVIMRRRPLRTSVNMLILNLAAVSLLCLVFGVPTVLIHDILFPLIKLSLRSAMCKFFPYVLHVTFYVTSYSVVSVCTMHFLMLWSSDCVTRYKSSRDGIVASAVIWTVTLFGNLPILIGYDVSGEDRNAQCHYKEITSNRAKRKLWVSTHFTFGCALPACVIFILCTVILYHTHKSDSRDYHYISERKSRSKTRQSVVTAALLVALFYVVCWVPFQVLLVVDVMSSPDHVSYVFDVTMEIFMCLAYMFPTISAIVCLVCPGTVRNGLQEHVTEQKETERMLHRSVLLKDGIAVTRI